MQRNGYISSYLRNGLIVLSLVFVLTGCSLLGQSNTPSVGATVAALNAQATSIAEQQTKVASDVQATVISQQSNQLSQQATMQAQLLMQSTQAPAQQPTDTTAPVVTQAPAETAQQTTTPENTSITLDKLEVNNWVPVKSNVCKDPKTTCYEIIMSHRVLGTIDTKESINIDSSWTNPYLVFWTRYNTKGSYDRAFGFVEIESPGSVGWGLLQGFQGSRDKWYKEALPLTDYKGQAIRIRFYAEYADRAESGEIKPYYEWFIQSMQISPSYVYP